MSTAFFRGQQLGREDLNIFLVNSSGSPSAAAEISYALYDFTTGSEVLLGNPERAPSNPSHGEYYASIIIPLDANLGDYRIRWTFREYVGGPLQQVLQEFSVIDKVVPNLVGPTVSPIVSDLGRSLRILLRDNQPDRNYRFQPPAHEETISQYNRVFGHIWLDEELYEYLARSLDMIIAAPPQTPFASIDSMVQLYPQWKTLLLTGAMGWALNALRINWISEEFDYSIGGVSLSIEKSSKYEAAYQSMTDQFDKQIEKAKATVKIIRGLQQPRFGMGVRSAFGPYVGAGVLTPRKFSGF